MGRRSQLIVTTHSKNTAARRGRHYRWVWGVFMRARVNQLTELFTTWSNTTPSLIKYEPANTTADAIIATYNINRENGDVQGFTPGSVIDDESADFQDADHGIVLVDYDNVTGAWTLGHIDRDIYGGWKLTAGDPFEVGADHLMDAATAERIARTPVAQ